MHGGPFPAFVSLFIYSRTILACLISCKGIFQLAKVNKSCKGIEFHPFGLIYMFINTALTSNHGLQAGD